MSTTENPDTASIDAMSFEAALAALEQVVARLESAQVPLDESIALYERGQALKAHCETRLASAQARIEQIRVGADGQAAGVAPFDPAES